MAFELNLAHMSISDLLEKAVESNEVIYTRANQRRLGKTKALMSYAEINQLPVIVPERLKRDYLKRYPKVRILGDAEVTYIDALPLILLCDEGVPKRTIEELKTRGHGVSGFLNESLEDSVMNAVNGEKSIIAFRKANPLLLKIELMDVDSELRTKAIVYNRHPYEKGNKE
ncbi:hypothetical protein [Bacillus velezensis]|uniref:hypothetical protein n=1 Tax=Bacillus velezensis TaxID=492670 RepID=UPI001919E8E2|nr:hypothetical protein [Bacillus velezensis]UQX44870.1 hypothetical protein M5J22_09640 [Bacillus velezensis]